MTVVCCCTGGTLLPYMLDEKNNWALHMESLQQSVKQARAQGKAVRGLVFINPGNPTGNRPGGDSGDVTGQEVFCLSKAISS